jgi:hypothetical protein
MNDLIPMTFDAKLIFLALSEKSLSLKNPVTNRNPSVNNFFIYLLNYLIRSLRSLF